MQFGQTKSTYFFVLVEACVGFVLPLITGVCPSSWVFSTFSIHSYPQLSHLTFLILLSLLTVLSAYCILVVSAVEPLPTVYCLPLPPSMLFQTPCPPFLVLAWLNCFRLSSHLVIQVLLRLNRRRDTSSLPLCNLFVLRL